MEISSVGRRCAPPGSTTLMRETCRADVRAPVSIFASRRLMPSWGSDTRSTQPTRTAADGRLSVVPFGGGDSAAPFVGKCSRAILERSGSGDGRPVRAGADAGVVDAAVADANPERDAVLAPWLRSARARTNTLAPGRVPARAGPSRTSPS